MTKDNVINFDKFDKIKKKKVIQVNDDSSQENLSPKELARRQKLEKEVIRINKRYKRLALAMKEADSDIQTNIRVLKYCFDMSVRLLPIAEEIYQTYKNERSVYALTALTTQVRELSNDLRMLSSNDKTIEHILESIFLPSLKLVLQHFINDFSDLKKEIIDTVPPKKAKQLKLRMNKMIKAQGQLLQDISSSVEQKVTDHFE
ncbi:MAG: hypothetical protein KGH75_01485 [Rhodospirillales bacterium]|nr:hypothetical protein [Rhodospirillales bacterium]